MTTENQQDQRELADYENGIQYPFPLYKKSQFSSLLEFQEFIRNQHGSGFDFQADLYYMGYDYESSKIITVFKPK